LKGRKEDLLGSGKAGMKKKRPAGNHGTYFLPINTRISGPGSAGRGGSKKLTTCLRRT